MQERLAEEMQMSRVKLVSLILAALVTGIVLGGYLFSDTRPRSFLALNKCQGTCLQPNELAGLLASVGIQRLPAAFVPSVVKETDKTIVIQHPSPLARIHYLVIPRKDIRDVGDLSDSDREYLVDLFDVMREIIREKKLVDYQVITNGPARQAANYLHFHLISR
jgi:histidine triad (HIT) family protein